MDSAEKFKKAYDTAEVAALEADKSQGKGRFDKDKMFSIDGAWALGGGGDKSIIRDNETSSLERTGEGGVGVRAASSYRASSDLPTPSGKVEYRSKLPPSPNTSIKRYDAEGNEVYNHDSVNPELAFQVGVVAAKKITEQAQGRIDDEQKAA